MALEVGDVGRVLPIEQPRDQRASGSASPASASRPRPSIDMRRGVAVVQVHQAQPHVLEQRAEADRDAPCVAQPPGRTRTRRPASPHAGCCLRRRRRRLRAARARAAGSLPARALPVGAHEAAVVVEPGRLIEVDHAQARRAGRASPVPGSSDARRTSTNDAIGQRLRAGSAEHAAGGAVAAASSRPSTTSTSLRCAATHAPPRRPAPRAVGPCPARRRRLDRTPAVRRSSRAASRGCARPHRARSSGPGRGAGSGAARRRHRPPVRAARAATRGSRSCRCRARPSRGSSRARPRRSSPPRWRSPPRGR